MNIISIDVECPWCGAQPGEPCTEGDGNGGIRPVSVMNLRGHIFRTKEVPDEPTTKEASDGSNGT